MALPTVTPQDLLAYVGATADETAFATAKVDEARELVGQYVGEADVPAEVLRGAVLEVGSKLWSRRSASGNEAQLDTLDAAGVMPAKDPMVTVYATLDRWLDGGFA